MNELELNVKTAEWFYEYIRIQGEKAKELLKAGAPADLVQDQLEGNIRSAAFDAVEFNNDTNK